jgi:hypothetical protein
MSPSLYPAHCRERSAESCGSSHATPASPSGRTCFSSRGSRHVLECSSAHWEPCRPSLVPGMTPAAGLAQRIGDSSSLTTIIPLEHAVRTGMQQWRRAPQPLYATSRRQRRQTPASRSLSSTLPSLPEMRDPKSWKQAKRRSDDNQCVFSGPGSSLCQLMQEQADLGRTGPSEPVSAGRCGQRRGPVANCRDSPEDVEEGSTGTLVDRRNAYGIPRARSSCNKQ